MKHLKKTLLAAMTIGFMFSMTGCGTGTKSDTAPADSAPAAEAGITEESPAGRYTSLGLEMGEYLISGKGLSGMTIELNEDGAGYLNFAENNAGPISSWSVDSGAFSMKAGVSDFTGTWENGVLHLNIGEEGDNTVIAFLKDGAEKPETRVITLDEYREMLQKKTAEPETETGGDESAAGTYEIYAVESNGVCVRIHEGEMIFTFDLKEDGTGTVTINDRTEKLLWKAEGTSLKLCETDGTPSNDQDNITIKDGIIRLETPAAGESDAVIDYFARKDADVSSIRITNER